MRQKEVVHQNILADSIFEKFELRELKFFLILISNVKKEILEYVIDTKEIKKFIGMSADSYEIFEKKILRLQGKKIYIPIDKDKYESYSIFSLLKFDKKEKIIKIIYNPFFFPFLVEFEGNFCKYKLKNIEYLSSKYSILIYILCKSKQFKKEFKLSVNEINSKVGKVMRSNNLDKVVFQPAIEEINKYTDLKIEVMKEYQSFPKGRYISGYKFKVSSKTLIISSNLKEIINAANKNIFIKNSKILNNKSIQILLDEFSEEELINGLKYAYLKINKDFRTLSYFKKVILNSISLTKKENIIVGNEINIEKIKNKKIDENNNLNEIMKYEDRILEYLITTENFDRTVLLGLKKNCTGIYYNILKGILKKIDKN